MQVQEVELPVENRVVVVLDRVLLPVDGVLAAVLCRVVLRLARVLPRVEPVVGTVVSASASIP